MEGKDDFLGAAAQVWGEGQEASCAEVAACRSVVEESDLVAYHGGPSHRGGDPVGEVESRGDSSVVEGVEEEDPWELPSSNLRPAENCCNRARQPAQKLPGTHNPSRLLLFSPSPSPDPHLQLL